MKKLTGYRRISFAGLVYFIVVEILIGMLLKESSIHDVGVAVLILFNVLAVFCYSMQYKGRIAWILFSSFILKIACMIWDIYFYKIFCFPNSHADSEGFYASAVMISKNIGLCFSTDYIYGGWYSKLIGILFWFVGESRILGQYVNVFLGMCVLFLVYEIGQLLNLEEKNILFAVAIVALLPDANILSAVFMREQFIIFFLTCSLYFFICWCKRRKILFSIMSILFVLFASTLHAGVIGISIIYMFMFAFYDGNKIRVKGIYIIFLVVLGISSSIFLTKYKNVFLGKFSNINGTDDILNAANTRRGGAAYLTWLNANSISQLVLFSPLLLFYFIGSPIPTDIRGISDAICFVFDGLPYLILCGYILKNFKMIKRNPVVLSLIVAVFFVLLTFALSVQNAGTAMRHRNKILPFLAVLVALVRQELQNQKRQKENYE